MSDQRKGGIAWTEQTWNPIRGCSRVSEGCRNCYAETVAARFSGPGQPYEGLVRLSAEGKHGRARWNGTVRFVPEKLAEPLRWTRPRRVFVNSMSDLFHEAVPFEQVAAIFGVMAAAHRHVFQVLTKRPERAREFFRWVVDQEGNPVRTAVVAARANGCDIGWPLPGAHPLYWPLPNVWLGVSVEDQKTADARVPVLLHTPAAVRWVSYEPAIGPVDFERWIDPVGVSCDDVCSDARFVKESEVDTYKRGRELVPCCPDFGASATWTKHDPGLDWIVVGGESGPGARPFELAWARRVIEQARVTGCRVFVKQLGAKPVDGWSSTEVAQRRVVRLDDRKGGDPSEWPEDLRVREWPEVSR